MSWWSSGWGFHPWPSLMKLSLVCLGSHRTAAVSGSRLGRMWTGLPSLTACIRLAKAGAHLILRYSPSRCWSRRCSRRVMSEMSGLYFYSGIGLGGSANRGKDRSGAVLDLGMMWVCQLLFCVGDAPVFSGRAGPARAGWFGIPCLSESWWGSCSLPGPSGRPIGTVPGVGQFLFPGWCPG